MDLCLPVSRGDLHPILFCPGNGLGIRVVGGKEIPGSRGEIGAYIAKVVPGGVAESTGKIVEGKRIGRLGLQWPLVD